MANTALPIRANATGSECVDGPVSSLPERPKQVRNLTKRPLWGKCSTVRDWAALRQSRPTEFDPLLPVVL